ncbi:MAG: hypothetical protein U0103_14480 [Candidatus Obscuribacterales bacterium]
MFDAPPANPQSVGDIIGRSFRLFRQNAPLLLREQITPCTIMAVGHIIIQFAATYGLKNPKDFGLILMGVAGFGIGMVISVIGFWFLTLKQFAFVRLANGLSVDYREALKFSMNKKWTIVGLFILSYFFCLGIFVVWGAELIFSVVLGAKIIPIAVIGATIGLLGMTVSIGLLSIYYLLMTSALACENERWTLLLGRVFHLLAHDVWRAFGFGILLSIIITILSWTLSLPIVALATIELLRSGFPANHMDPAQALPFYCLVLSQFWQAIINMFLVPISFMSAGLFYRDLKVRQEGLDVEYKLSQLIASGA